MNFDKQVIEHIGNSLKEKNSTVAAAESVTGGLLQAACTLGKNASDYFQGGITAFNVGQKYRHLLVEPLHAMSCDSVSKKIAEDMALQVCKLFCSNYGLASTGYASPMPEKNIHDLFAYYAISFNGAVMESGVIYSNEAEGLATQIFYVNSILQKFLHNLQKQF